MSTQPKYWTPQGLHKRWGGAVSLRTIYSWTKYPHRGPKRFTKKGEPVAFLLADVEEFERSNSRLMIALSKHAGGGQ